MGTVIAIRFRCDSIAPLARGAAGVEQPALPWSFSGGLTVGEAALYVGITSMGTVVTVAPSAIFATRTCVRRRSRICSISRGCSL